MKDNKSDLQLQAVVRAPMKNAFKKLHRKGLIPAVVYGPKIKNLFLSLKESTAVKYSKTSFDNKIFTLKSSDAQLNGLKVIKKETSYHCLTRKPVHIDFLALDMAKKVKVTVEIKFIGKAKGVKESGGVLNFLKRSVEVECFPNEIPDHFELDVSDLELNGACHISDISIPKNIKLISKPEETVCLVSSAQEEEKAPAEAGAAAEQQEAAGPESSSEGKKPEASSKEKSK